MGIRQFEPARAVEVMSPQYGSAYRIGGRLVLTAAHLLQEIGSECQIRSKTSFGIVKATVVWRATNADVALIELPENIEELSPIVFGQLPKTQSGEKIPFQMYGWPQWGRTEREAGRTAAGGRQVEGVIYLADTSPDGLLVLEALRLPEGSYNVGSDWEGNSGAAIVCEGLVIAVQRQHQNPKRPASLEAEPLVKISNDPQWRSWLVQHGISPEMAIARLPQNVEPDSATPLSREEYRERQVLLNRVHHAWIQGSLNHSLYSQIPLLLELEERQDRIELPWEISNAPRRSLPPGYKLIKLFDDLGAGQRLLILGNPGSGKSTMMLELVRDLIARCRHALSLPLPVVFQLSTWKNPHQPLAHWLVEELYSKYEVNRKTAQRWIEQQQLLLCLDGLDEVQPTLQEACVRSLNQFAQEHGQTEIIVCSRLEDYEQLSIRLRFQTAVSIQLLTPAQIESYFHWAGSRLDGIRTALQDDPILAELARTPLFLWIMFLAYEGIAATNISQSLSRDNQIRHLFDRYFDRMAAPPRKGQRYPHPQATSETHIDWPYTRSQTSHWLRFLAQQIQREGDRLFLIEHLHPGWLFSRTQRWLYRLGVGVLSGMIIAWVYGLPMGLIVARLGLQMPIGGLTGFVLGFWASLGNEIKLLDTLTWQWNWTQSRQVAIPGLLSGPLLALGFWFYSVVTDTFLGGFWVIFQQGLFAGMGIALIAGLLAGFVPTKSDNRLDQQVNRGIWRSAQKSAATLPMGLLLILVLQWPLSQYFLPMSAILGALSLYLGGLTCIQHLTLRLILWCNGKIPWNYAQFLDYARDRLLLKPAGGGYLFIHGLLQDNLSHSPPSQTVRKSLVQRYPKLRLTFILSVLLLLTLSLPFYLDSWQLTSQTQEIIDRLSPRVQIGDRILVQNGLYFLTGFHRGDILVFQPPHNDLLDIKQVLGCPGDQIEITHGQVKINDRVLQTKFFKIHPSLREYGSSSVPRGHYLLTVNSDLYNNPKDGFLIGLVPQKNIRGRLLIRFWPLNRAGIIPF